MPNIDSQVHAYEANTPRRPWHSVPNWPPHVTGDEYSASTPGASRSSNRSTRRIRPSEPWADLPKVLGLAKRPNALIKLSGACTLSREPYPSPDIWDPLARLFDASGFERCLWAPTGRSAFAVVNYEQAVEPFLGTDRLSESERAMLMGGACAKAYGWSPRKG